MSFEQFWTRYPLRVGKLDAQKAFKAALKLASLEDILAGVDRYVATKPDWQQWKGPVAWLRAGKWMDERVSDRRNGDRRQEWHCPHQPPCGSPTVCHNLEIVNAARRAAGRPEL